MAHVIERRRANAARYDALLDRGTVFVAPDPPEMYNTYHLYVVQVDRRDELQGLYPAAARGVQTKVHYPVPGFICNAGGYATSARGSGAVRCR